MQDQVFVQSRPDRKFVVSVVGIPDTTVEGSTKEKAIANAKLVLKQQLASGELVTIDVDAENLTQEVDPWIEHMGIFADDPTFDDFLEEVAVYRQQVDDRAVEE
jgi:predicted RNase H-like HicB family nuclease